MRVNNIQLPNSFKSCEKSAVLSSKLREFQLLGNITFGNSSILFKTFHEKFVSTRLKHFPCISPFYHFCLIFCNLPWKWHFFSNFRLFYFFEAKQFLVCLDLRIAAAQWYRVIKGYFVIFLFLTVWGGGK